MADPAGGAVLLVEDEPSIADNVIFALKGEGFSVEWRTLGREAVALVSRQEFDLVILDVGLPDGSGFDRCKEIRALSEVPIVFLTARADEVDRVVGLEIGADDYVTKPFSPRELAARVKSILRRSRSAREAGIPAPLPVQSRGFVVDDERARITYRGIVLALTRYEYLLLKFLAGHPGRVYSRAQLLDQVWGSSQTSLERTVDAHVKTLRAKLHAVEPGRDPISTHRGFGYSLSEEPERVRIGVRVFLGYFLIVGLGVFFLMRIFIEELKPGVRQSTEETLVDTANLLAELVAGEVKQGTLASGEWKRAVDAYARRKLDARISGFVKAGVNHRIYVTDARGIVLYDSDGKDVGADYSRWNDVYLTLRGKYGARSTRSNPSNELSSIMYVAAPIMDGDTIIGVVTVGKPNLSVQPFIEAGRRNLLRAGFVLVLLSLGVGLAFSYAMSRSVERVVRYAEDLSSGRRVPQPALPGELRSLGRAVTNLREQLDGKTYVEEYVHSFLHEIKSPLAAIYGAAELLEGEMSAQERARFLENIRAECQRLREILDRLLDLARIEQRQALEAREPVGLRGVAEEIRASVEPRLAAAQLRLTIDVPQDLIVPGDSFLLHRAISNLVDNAIQFTPPGATITLSAKTEGNRIRLRVHNAGEPIPDFALPRVFERFYSLPRPGTQKKSTGLGLSFVREVALLHHGHATIENAPEGGVAASILLPLA